MNNRTLYHHIILSSVLAVTLAGPAAASEIYKWTDPDGNVQYGDKPMGDPSERIDIASRNTDPSAVQAQVQARLDRQSAREEREAEARSGEPTADEVRSDRKAREEKCASSRERLTLLLQSRRVYRQDEKGERVYLDESETQSARTKATKDVEENCGS